MRRIRPLRVLAQALRLPALVSARAVSAMPRGVTGTECGMRARVPLRPDARLLHGCVGVCGRKGHDSSAKADKDQDDDGLGDISLEPEGNLFAFSIAWRNKALFAAIKCSSNLQMRRSRSLTQTWTRCTNSWRARSRFCMHFSCRTRRPQHFASHVIDKHVFVGVGQRFQHRTRGRFIACAIDHPRDHYVPDLLFDDGDMPARYNLPTWRSAAPGDRRGCVAQCAAVAGRGGGCARRGRRRPHGLLALRLLPRPELRHFQRCR